MRGFSAVAAAALLTAACALMPRGPARTTVAAPVDYVKIKPVDLVDSTPKGKLHNPYQDTQAGIVADGRRHFIGYGCSGCHGDGGGGGMCPPLINGVWLYGGDDDTLFRLVTLGSIALQQRGYRRIGHEDSVGPMPPLGGIIKNADDLWKILAFVRSRYDGDPAYKFGGQKRR